MFSISPDTHPHFDPAQPRRRYIQPFRVREINGAEGGPHVTSWLDGSNGRNSRRSRNTISGTLPGNGSPLHHGTSCSQDALLSFRRLHSGCQNGRTEAPRKAHSFAPPAASDSPDFARTAWGTRHP